MTPMRKYKSTIFQKMKLQEEPRLKLMRLQRARWCLAMTGSNTPKKSRQLATSSRISTKTYANECKSFSFLAFSLQKYATISKNVIFYLCYVSLEVNDFAGCINYGQELLRTYPTLQARTEFQTKQYIAEAYTMIGNPGKAYQIL